MSKKFEALQNCEKPSKSEKWSKKIKLSAPENPWYS